MLLKKEIPQFDGRTLVANANFEKSSSGFAERHSQNTYTKNGKLFVVKKLQKTTSQNVLAAYQCPKGLVLFTSGGVFLHTDGESTQISNKVFNSPAILYCEKRQMVVISQKNVGTFIFADEWQKCSDLGFDSIAIFREHLFGVDGNKLCFSQRDDFSDLDGEILLEQRATAVTVWNDCLWVVGNTLFKVEFDDNQQNSKISAVASGLGNVFAKSVAVFFNNLIMLTKSGLFCYSQNKLKQIAQDVSFSNTSDAMAVIWQNKYWLCLNNHTVLAFGEEFDFVNLSISANFLSAKDELLFVKEGVWKFSESFADGFWQSNVCNFGEPSSKKYFRKLLIETKNNVTVHIVTEHERRIYHILGAKNIQKINIRGVFKQFFLEIFSEGETEISSVALVAETFEKEDG